MAKKITEIPTSVLLNYQQLLEFTSRSLYGLFQEAETLAKTGEVSPGYVSKIEKEFHFKLGKNNEASASIDKEICKRVRGQFGKDVTLSDDMARISEAFEQERDRMFKLKEKKDLKPSIKSKPKSNFKIVKDD